MLIKDLLNKLNKLPEQSDVYIANNSITTWPIQIPIDNITLNPKTQTAHLHLADVQFVPPQFIIEKLTFNEN